MERVFPLEIFQLIIDEVALTGENSDLHACCVVCQDFLHLCRAHLFRDLCFRSNEPYRENLKLKPRLQSLIQTLNKNPYLKGFVQSISFPYECYPGLGTTSEYEEELENELKMLLELPNMHDLSICAFPGYIDYQISRTDILSYRTLIDRYMISGSLTHLSLGYVNNLPFLPIFGSPYLVRLQLRGCEGILWSPEESLPRHESAIKQLNVYRTNNFPYQIIKCFRKLEQLDISGQPNERLPSHIIQSLQEIPACFKHLKRLTSWGGIDWPTILSPRINGHVKALPAVRYLKIEFYHARDVTDANAVLDNVEEIEELELAGSTSDAQFSSIELHKVFGEMHHSLKSIEIDLVWDASFSHMIVDKAVESMSSQPKHMLETLSLALCFRLREHVDFEGGDYEQWRNLASLLVDRGRFPRLNDVYIRIVIERDASDEYDVVADDFLAEPLKALLETELFMFRLETDIHTIW